MNNANTCGMRCSKRFKSLSTAETDNQIQITSELRMINSAGAKGKRRQKKFMCQLMLSTQREWIEMSEKKNIEKLTYECTEQCGTSNDPHNLTFIVLLHFLCLAAVAVCCRCWFMAMHNCWPAMKMTLSKSNFKHCHPSRFPSAHIICEF